MNAPVPAGGDRETGRVWAFCHHVGERYFPLYELEEYEQVAYDVPITRFGWSIERIHDLDMPVGELLLLSLCGDPYIFDSGLRVTILEAAERHVPRELLEAIPGDGLPPSELRARLEGTPYAAAADFAEWIFRDTGSIFLDCDEEDAVQIDWTRENVDELTEQWRAAAALLERTGELARWLEASPAAHYAQLVDALVGGEAHADYLRERHHYAYEITEAGFAPVRSEGRDVPVPASPAG